MLERFPECHRSSGIRGYCDPRVARKDRLFSARIWLALALVAGGLLLVSAPAFAARFYTWVDAQGHLHTTVIKDSDNPLEKRAEAVRRARKAAQERRAHQASPAQKESGLPPGAEAGKGAKAPSPTKGQTHPPGTVSRSGSPVAKPIVGVKTPGGRAAATSAPEPAHKPSRPVGAAGSATQKSMESSKQDSQFNLKNYPNGEDLARHGYVRDPNHRPFFSWFDALGIEHATPYQPPPDKRELESTAKADKSAASVRIHSLYTEARVLRPGMAAGIPKNANPAAIKFLGLDKTPSLFAHFKAYCCRDLSQSDVLALPADRRFEVTVTDRSPVHRFDTGTSPYRLVRLPKGGGAYDLQVRSFIHHGVFVPSLVFLSDKFRISRVVTDMVFDYVPETWYRYGFLHARVAVHPGKSERWLLIYTRKQDLKDETVVDRGGRTLSIPHKATGSLGLETVAPGTRTASLW